MLPTLLSLLLVASSTRPWTPLEIAHYPPFLTLPTTKTAWPPFYAKYTWFPVWVDPRVIRDNRAYWLIRKRGWLKTGDVVLIERLKGGKVAQWYDVPLTLTRRIYDGARYWKASLSGIPVYRTERLTPVEWVPEVKHLQVEGPGLYNQ